MSERESMQFDVIIVGGGVAGLSAAIRLKQLNSALEICVLEKAAEFGGHIVSGAVMEPRALGELLGDYQAVLGDFGQAVSQDLVYYLPTSRHSIQLKDTFVPKSMHNAGNLIISLGVLVKKLAEYAESLDITLLAGFAASSVLYGDDGEVVGVQTGDMGRDSHGNPKPSYEAGYHLFAKYTLFAEGCRGHLGKQIISRFGLDHGKDPQHYAIGLKETWKVASDKHTHGVVMHGAGWPLSDTGTGGGFWLYFGKDTVSYGIVVDLSYQNPYVSPFDELQRLKTHPLIADILTGGERLEYGARALTKGGLNSLPKLYFKGGLLIGDDAGFLNPAKIKGTHTAIKSGMLAAEAVADALTANRAHDEIADYPTRIQGSWLYEDQKAARNFSPAMHRMGALFGGVFNYIDQKIGSPFSIHDTTPDYVMERAHHAYVPSYPKPDGVLTFDKLSSVYISNTNHAEDQPCHLKLIDNSVPIAHNLPIYAEPAQRYCPAGVYEVHCDDDGARFVINAQNCIHCKTCDIKDPAQNIIWTTPEGGGGPNYSAM